MNLSRTPRQQRIVAKDLSARLTALRKFIAARPMHLGKTASADAINNIKRIIAALKDATTVEAACAEAQNLLFAWCETDRLDRT